MSKKKATPATTVRAALYDVLLAPVVTEKSTTASEFGKVVFRVKPETTKAEVKAAVEAIFKVNVTKVNTITVHGKTKMFRGRGGVRSDSKKAIVTLKPGQSIDYASGV